MSKYRRVLPPLPSGSLLGIAILTSTFVGYYFDATDESLPLGIVVGSATFCLFWLVDTICCYGFSWTRPDDGGRGGRGDPGPEPPWGPPPSDGPRVDRPLFIDDVLMRFAKHSAPTSQPDRESIPTGSEKI